jgi:hypothetical protein
VGAVIALTATGAAAATGSLPDHAQNGLARAAEHIGVNLPDTANDKARDATQTDSSDSDEAPDTGATTVEEQGTPTDTHSSDDDATGDASEVEQPTADASDTNANHGSVVSQTAHDADKSGGKGEEVSPVARDNHGAEVRTETGDTHGQSGTDHGRGPADAANEHAGGNAAPRHGKP